MCLYRAFLEHDLQLFTSNRGYYVAFLNFIIKLTDERDNTQCEDKIMGMAASQARFLNLTARKTNIEYEGQQINQQRTALSNESANLYNQMLSLSVPVPPNTNDYTKVEYAFMVPGTENEATVSQITKVKGTDNQYTVTYSYVEQEQGFNICPTTNQSTVDPTKVSITDNRDPKNVKSYQTYQITTATGKVLKLYKYGEVTSADAQHKDAYDNLCNGTGDMYMANVGTDEKPNYQYYKGSDLDKAVGTTGNGKASYYSAGTVTVPKTESYSPCKITRDKNNRVSSFTYTPADGDSQEFAVTTKTITDDAAYNDAMNEYTYQNYLYEQQMNQINAKTSVVQAQDRELELRLKQLDTEHNAVQTEMESVKAVCKKNTEDSFKTFA